MDERSLPDLFGPDFEAPGFPDENGEFLRGLMLQGVSSCLYNAQIHLFIGHKN